MAKKFNFNEWREKYSSYSFKEQKDIINKLELNYPRQRQFNFEGVSNFLINIPKPKVLEIGGWKGELASEILDQNKNVILWHNYDICSNAIDKSVCKDKRFKAILLTDFAWNLDIFLEYNVCVASHVIEHVMEHELIKFFNRIKHIKYIFIDSPLEHPYLLKGWKNYAGTHILKCGWNSIKNMLKNYNEVIVNNHIRTYSLKSSGRSSSISKQ